MIQIGMIGAGRIGRVHGESISRYGKGAKLKAVADPLMNGSIRKWAADMGIPCVYDDYRKILEDPEIDAVLICSSTDTHAQISVEAIRAGKHVFCEKPIDHSPSRIRTVLDELKKSGVKYQVGFNRRFDHNFRAVRDAVAAGKIGDPHILKITSRDPNPPTPEYIKVSGGMFLDMTIHDFDMTRYLLGCEATEVYAAGAVLVDPAIGKAGDIDTAVVTLEMEDGALAVIDNSRKAAYGYDQRAEVFGSKGQIAISNDTASSAVFSGADGVTAEKPLYFFLERYLQAYAEEIDRFGDAISNDRPVSPDANDGLQAVRIAVAAKKSCEEHRPVRLSEIED